MKNRKKLFAIAGMIGITIVPTLITVPVLLVNKLEDKYLYFDDKVFDSKEDLQEYFLNNESTKSWKYNASSYLLDGKVFSTQVQLDQYLNEKFKIRNLKSNKIPSDYTINSSGELSKDVLLNQNEEAITVYEGNNGIAYQDPQKAIESFYTYQKAYNVKGHTAYTEQEAKDMYENIILKDLEASDAIKDDVYLQGATWFTETELKQLIRQDVKKGFELDGKKFSGYNAEEFNAFYIASENKLIRENIREVRDADKRAYWITHDTNDDQGYFIGPKYVETVNHRLSLIF